jgi:hypothetical protein
LITGIWYLGWLLSFAGAIGTVTELFRWLGKLANPGAAVVAHDSAIASVPLFLVALAIALVGAFLVFAARPDKLRQWGVSTSVIDWAEDLPTDAPTKHLTFYGSFFALALCSSLISSIAHPDSAELTPVLVLFAPLIGWLMVWAVLGFQLINPVTWAFPESLKYEARFFHFVAVVNLVSAPFVWLASGFEEREATLAMAAMIGAAVGATQFYRYRRARQTA